jgi:hypothetical protein
MNVLNVPIRKRRRISIYSLLCRIVYYPSDVCRYSIHGETDLEEIELNHLDGYRSSRPVRIGNGAANHLQLDIYGGSTRDNMANGQSWWTQYTFITNSLNHAVGICISFSDVIDSRWLKVRKIADYVVKNWRVPDMYVPSVTELIIGQFGKFVPKNRFSIPYTNHPSPT